ncbi:hypothetical protein BCR36DRAFT_587036 [Piromyces finnis]|uniref:Uncharacterized protein n=1 Tax=Piromyces finnis TaxID=1754191 RepID=A0A1Y1UZE9_9FUNG|nr:hypothetical protein BCR36DRAFT_587036 [Piromyces finnis]|eukprot:ORX42765.1 hypothetical protein BCR36DRAFT_587036 [Piromyces finnis]
MYQMPQPEGGFPPQPPYGGYQMPQGGYQMPQPGGFNNTYNTYNNYNGADDESEYEYITDDDGDYIEDEDGTILTTEEAQNRGLIEPATGERGIGKKLLIGGAVVWLLRKQLKKKKKVKKQKTSQINYSNQPNPNIYGQNIYQQTPLPPQNIYGNPQNQMKYNNRGPGGFGGW